MYYYLSYLFKVFELLYGPPVLLNGLAALVLKKLEVLILQHHYKLSLERLQRLHKASPDSVVHFLGGSLHLQGLLHIRQLSLLEMISRLGRDNILYKIGCSTLSNSKPSSHSWFLQVQTICQQYSLPIPLSVLTNPQSKFSFKNKVRSHAKPSFHSLAKPHPLWSSAGPNPYEEQKATIQANMLSGGYHSCWLSRHWSGDSSGTCSLPS